LAKALKLAVKKSGVTKHVTAHTFRHYPDNFVMPS
jgi:integrase